MTRLKIAVDPVYEETGGFIRAALRCVLEIAGWQSEDAESLAVADVVYGNGSGRRAPLGDRAAVVLPGMPPSRWRALQTSAPRAIDGVVLPDKAVSEDTGGWDPIAVAGFFVAGMHERDPAIRNEPGPYPMPAAGIAAWGLDHDSPVHLASIRTAAALLAASNVPKPAPRWPAGKHWAVALTHDFDRFQRYRPLAFARSAYRALRSGNVRDGALQLGKAAASVAGRWRGSDPYTWSLNEWVRIQNRLGIRSAIYVASIGENDPVRDALDVTYDIRDRRLGATLRAFAKDGWEIGLHTSIRAWKGADELQRQRERLESVIGTRVVGNRAHYWAIDQDDPSRSLSRLEQAGFCYDSSLGMNSVHGHRRGVNYPYRPLETSTGALMDIWEVPPTMMDQSLWAAGSSAAGWRQALCERIEETRQHQGLLVLDWHTDSLAPGYMGNSAATVVDALGVLRAEGDCWIATPREIVEWCHTGRWG